MVVNEAERLEQMYARIDPEAPLLPEVADMVKKAAQIAGSAMAALNLLDGQHQCQLGAYGFEGSVTPREDAMCNVTLDEGSFIVLTDAHQDPRFAHNPWVDGRLAEVSFYASIPLMTRDRFAIGTLCLFDTVSRELSGMQVLRLLGLASEIVEALERDRSIPTGVRRIRMADLLSD